VGEHPDLIVNPSKRAELIALLRRFISRFGKDPTIHSIDLMNEPEFVTAADPDGVRTFLGELAVMIREEAPGQLVTIGSANRGRMSEWAGTGVDFHQYHYFDHMEAQFPFDHPADQLGLSGPVLIGEVEPKQVAQRLSVTWANGYRGLLFWRDAEHPFPASDYEAWVEAHQ
jgi:hypothetical protein